MAKFFYLKDGSKKMWRQMLSKKTIKVEIFSVDVKTMFFQPRKENFLFGEIKIGEKAWWGWKFRSKRLLVDKKISLLEKDRNSRDGRQ